MSRDAAEKVSALSLNSVNEIVGVQPAIPQNHHVRFDGTQELFGLHALLQTIRTHQGIKYQVGSQFH